MPLLSHELERDFPGLEDTIRRLRASDAHFSQLCDQYRSLDAEISRIEDNKEEFSDFEFEDLKKRRLHLKDEIDAILRRERA
jgi:uncharacterized protein YdcH (DUF465 family)